MALIHRPWWNRVWVLQEVAVAKNDPLLICGMRSALWSDFIAVAEIFQSAPSLLTSGFDQIAKTPAKRATLSAAYETAAYAWIREHVQKKSPSMSLPLLLRSSLTLESTYPRDKVYALIGLAHPSDQAALVPDYSKTVGEVYIVTTRHLISSTGSLNFLSYNTNSPNLFPGSASQTATPLPSWVSDWSVTASRPHPLFHSGIYKASNNYRAEVHPSNDERCLVVRGFIVDTIHAVSEVLHSCKHKEGPSEFDGMLDHLETMLNNFIAERVAAFPTSSRELEAW
jgi:hypothetical protein